MSLFELQNVKFDSRSQPIIRGISLTIEKGTVTGLVGKSGSGKSTLLKLIAGILVPTSGHVLFHGKDIQTMNNFQNKLFRKKCSFVFQDSALWANQNIQQNLMLPLQTQSPKMSNEERMRKIKKICETVRYDRPLELRPVDLSMGEQKKIAFARALINEPEVLFLDECTESLDQRGSAEIIELLQKFIADGNTVVFVSHNSNFINEMNGKLYELEKGELVVQEIEYEI
ncbi:cell division ATP-binding protein FtsE [Treponema zioleckii]|uniref:cell division ATP-binding protein FtsE n=1 Tax=Treponema zioleckii TaxID=331680 RepID=UPI00168A92CC|nr:ABC transporter ATP-binding protein [Treponema zioleckii]